MQKILINFLSIVTFTLIFCVAINSAESEMAESFVNQNTFTVEQAVSLASKENQGLKAARHVVEQAEGRLKQAGLWPNIEIEIAVDSDKTFSNEGEYETTTGFSQKFPISGRLSKAEEIARVDVAMALAEVADKERLLKGEVRTKAREILILTEKLEVNKDLQRSISELIDVLQKRFRVGEVSETTLNMEKFEFQKLELFNNRLRAELLSAQTALNVLLGREPAYQISIESDRSGSSAEFDLASIAKEAWLRRPDRQLVALSVDKSSAETALAKAQRWEDWKIGFGYSKGKSIYDQPIGNQDDQFLGVSLSVPLPFWNNNEGRILETKAANAQAQAELSALELRIKQEVLSAQLKLQQLAEVVQTYQTRSIPLAEKNIALLKRSYTDGLIGATDLIQGLHQLVEIKTLYLDVKGEYFKTLSEFQTVSAYDYYLKFD